MFLGRACFVCFPPRIDYFALPYNIGPCCRWWRTKAVAIARSSFALTRLRPLSLDLPISPTLRHTPPRPVFSWWPFSYPRAPVNFHDIPLVRFGLKRGTKLRK